MTERVHFTNKYNKYTLVLDTKLVRFNYQFPYFSFILFPVATYLILIPFPYLGKLAEADWIT